MTFLIIWMHFVSDFIFQTDQMAMNKSRSNKWLTIHIAAYSAPWLILGWKYALINGAAHWVTDWISSRITSKLWQKQARHWFFVVIGADQAIHMTILFLTIPFAEPLWTRLI